jgi:hypothetical protein
MIFKPFRIDLISIPSPGGFMNIRPFPQKVQAFSAESLEKSVAEALGLCLARCLARRLGMAME